MNFHRLIKSFSSDLIYLRLDFSFAYNTHPKYEDPLIIDEYLYLEE